jgi:hypothetical protein
MSGRQAGRVLVTLMRHLTTRSNQRASMPSARDRTCARGGGGGDWCWCVVLAGVEWFGVVCGVWWASQQHASRPPTGVAERQAGGGKAGAAHLGRAHQQVLQQRAKGAIPVGVLQDAQHQHVDGRQHRGAWRWQGWAVAGVGGGRWRRRQGSVVGSRISRATAAGAGTSAGAGISRQYQRRHRLQRQRHHPRAAAAPPARTHPAAWPGSRRR